MADDTKSAASVESSTGAAVRRSRGRSRITISVFHVGASGSTHIRTVVAEHGPDWPPPLSPVDWPDCDCPLHAGGAPICR